MMMVGIVMDAVVEIHEQTRERGQGGREKKTQNDNLVTQV